jgi:hypothetical protein
MEQHGKDPIETSKNFFLIFKFQWKKALEIISRNNCGTRNRFCTVRHCYSGFPGVVCQIRVYECNSLAYHNSNRAVNCCDAGAVRPIVHDKEA